MFAEEIRRAIPATPRVRLADLSAAVWKGFACGALSEEDAQQLAEEIAARKAVPVTVEKSDSDRRYVGSRPRTAESIERRRRWTGSGWLPPQLAARFTMGETAVLAVVAAEVAKGGRCALAIGHIAALAGVSRSTVKTALREARALGALSIEHRPERPFRHRPNIVRIVSPEWQSWISMRRSSQGVRTATPTNTQILTRRERSGSSAQAKVQASQAAGQILVEVKRKPPIGRGPMGGTC